MLISINDDTNIIAENINTPSSLFVKLNKGVKELGCDLEDAFMTLGFLSLPVIPELKITDKGVFETNKFDFVNIFETNVVPV